MEVFGGLAYETRGRGVPVVFLHGLTFDSRTWRPIIQQLGDSVQSIAIDLPAHGQSPGAPNSVFEVASQVHGLLEHMAVESPIVVGHSISGAIACLYAARYTTRGVVIVDQGPDIRPFARLARQLEPALRGPQFAQVWQTFEGGLGLDRIPEPVRSLVLDAHEVKQDVVLGYWDMMLRTDPDELQAVIDAQLARINVPVLGFFGRSVPEEERANSH